MDGAIRVVVLVTVGGGIGGLLYWTSLYLSSANAENPAGRAFPKTRAFCFAQTFMGAGGAWALLLAMLWGKRAPLNDNIEDALQMFAGSLVAGFAGSKLLPMVADQLTKQFLKDVQKNAAKSADRAARSELTSEVYTYLAPNGSQTVHQTKSYITQLRARLKQEPRDRKAAILLARVLSELQNDPKKSIDVLKSFIKAKLVKNASPDGDVADAYWNIANYAEQLYGVTKLREHREAAIQALYESTKTAPGYLDNLRADPDFADLRQDVETKKKLPLL